MDYDDESGYEESGYGEGKSSPFDPRDYSEQELGAIREESGWKEHWITLMEEAIDEKGYSDSPKDSSKRYRDNLVEGVDSNETVLESRLSNVSMYAGENLPDYMKPSGVTSLDPHSYEPISYEPATTERSREERVARDRVKKAFEQAEDNKAIDAMGEIRGDADSFTGNYVDRFGEEFQALNNVWKINGEHFEEAANKYAKQYFTDDLPKHLEESAYKRAALYLNKAIPTNIKSMKPAMGGDSYLGYADALPRIKGLENEFKNAFAAKDKYREIAKYLKPQAPTDDNITTLFGFPKLYGESYEKNELYTKKKNEVRDFVREMGRVHGISRGAITESGRTFSNSSNTLAVKNNSELNYSDIADNAQWFSYTRYDEAGHDSNDQLYIFGEPVDTTNGSAMGDLMRLQREGIANGDLPRSNVDFETARAIIEEDDANTPIFDHRIDHGPPAPSESYKGYKRLDGLSLEKNILDSGSFIGPKQPTAEEDKRNWQPDTSLTQSQLVKTQNDAGLSTIKHNNPNLSFSTNEQGTIPWVGERMGNATGTDAHPIITGKANYGKGSALDYLSGIRDSIGRDKDDNDNFKIGHLGEAQGKRLFEERYGHKLVDSGLMTNSKYPNLGISPDAMYTDEDGKSRLVEFKTSTYGGGKSLASQEAAMKKHEHQLRMQLAVSEFDSVELMQSWSDDDRAFNGNARQYEKMPNSAWKSRSAGRLDRDTPEQREWESANMPLLQKIGAAKKEAIESGDFSTVEKIMRDAGRLDDGANNTKSESTEHNNKILGGILGALTGDSKGLYRAFFGGGGGGGNALGLLGKAGPVGQGISMAVQAGAEYVNYDSGKQTSYAARGMYERQREAEDNVDNLIAAGLDEGQALSTAGSFERMQARASVGKMDSLTNVIAQTRDLISADTLMNGSISEAAVEFIRNARRKGYNNQEIVGLASGSGIEGIAQYAKYNDKQLDDVLASDSKRQAADDAAKGILGSGHSGTVEIKKMYEDIWAGLGNWVKDGFDGTDYRTGKVNSGNAEEQKKLKVDIQVSGKNVVDVKTTGEGVEQTTVTKNVNEGVEEH